MANLQAVGGVRDGACTGEVGFEAGPCGTARGPHWSPPQAGVLLDHSMMTQAQHSPHLLPVPETA